MYLLPAVYLALPLRLFNNPNSSSNASDFNSTSSNFSLTFSNSHWKPCLCTSIASACALLITCSSRPTSDITFCFHSSMRNFSARSSWVAICLIAASTLLLPRVATRVSCFAFNLVATFPLVVLRAHRLTHSSFPSRPPADAQCPCSDAEPRSHVPSLLWWSRRSRPARHSPSLCIPLSPTCPMTKHCSRCLLNSLKAI